MSGAAMCPHALRVRIGRAVHEYLLQHPPAEVARLLNLSPTTISRDRMAWGDDASRWPLFDALELAKQDKPEGLALQALLLQYVKPDDEPTPAPAPQRGALALTAQMGMTTNQLATALHDGRIDADEARDLLPRLRQLQQQAAQVMADCIRTSEGG